MYVSWAWQLFWFSVTLISLMLGLTRDSSYENPCYWLDNIPNILAIDQETCNKAHAEEEEEWVLWHSWLSWPLGYPCPLNRPLTAFQTTPCYSRWWLEYFGLCHVYGRPLLSASSDHGNLFGKKTGRWKILCHSSIKKKSLKNIA